MVEMAYLKMLLKTIKVLEEKNITWEFFGEYASHVGFARESTLDAAKDVEAKVFLWIDSDILWSPEDVLKIYGSDKDVISGTYVMETGNAVAKTDHWLEPHEIFNADGPINLDFCGLGFFAIKGEVLKSIPEPRFASTLVTDMEGEDIAFCKKLKAAGFDIWLDPSIRLGHVKKRVLTL
jgi:hypothetical protein